MTNKYRVVYAATYVGEKCVYADSREAAEERVIEECDPEHTVMCLNDGTSLEFDEGKVTRVDLSLEDVKP